MFTMQKVAHGCIMAEEFTALIKIVTELGCFAQTIQTMAANGLQRSVIDNIAVMELVKSSSNVVRLPTRIRSVAPASSRSSNEMLKCEEHHWEIVFINMSNLKPTRRECSNCHAVQYAKTEWVDV